MAAWRNKGSIELPEGWEHSVEDGIVTIHHPDGVGAMHLSFAKRERPGKADEQEVVELAKSWIESHGWPEVPLRTVQRNERPTVEMECVQSSPGEEPSFWKVWIFLHEKRAATLSYVSELSDRDVERTQREAIAASFEWQQSKGRR